MPSVVWGLKPRLWEESEEPGGRPAKEAARITQCQLAAPPCQVQMEPCLGLTRGSLGQLSPIPGAQGAGGEKICFPLILPPSPGWLPSLPWVAWPRALGVYRRRMLAACFSPKACVWGVRLYVCLAE